MASERKALCGRSAPWDDFDLERFFVDPVIVYTNMHLAPECIFHRTETPAQILAEVEKEAEKFYSS